MSDEPEIWSAERADEPAESDAAYVFDDAARARAQVELDRIDVKQAGHPTCALCGQRAATLDRFGLCRKVSDPHKDWRAGVRADEKAAIL